MQYHYVISRSILNDALAFSYCDKNKLRENSLAYNRVVYVTNSTDNAYVQPLINQNERARYICCLAKIDLRCDPIKTKQHFDRLVHFGPMLKLLFVRLPFMGVLLKQIQTRLNLMMMRVAPFIKLHIVYYNRCTIRSLLNKSLRTNIPVLQRSNVIYMMRCSDCSACYIGKTKRKLHT